jgi:hypothetical protein
MTYEAFSARYRRLRSHARQSALRVGAGLFGLVVVVGVIGVGR